MSLRVTPKRPRRTREWLRGTVLASAAEGFGEQLERRGYRPEVISNYLGGVAHFSHWLTRTRRRIEDVDEALIKVFLDRHVAACHCAKWCAHRRLELRLALVLLLQWLRQEQIVSAGVCPVGGLEAELAEFEHYLIGVCGLAASTRCQLLRHVRCFLSACFGRHPINFARLTAHDVRRFVEQHGARWRPISLRSVGVGLRSYFRFKALNGALVEPLGAAIPRVPRWRLTSLPKTLTEAEIDRLLGAFDRTRAKGLRDYAMARCLTDLGLRATEVTRMQLEDIDWDEGTIAIRGKGRRVDELPLPKALGCSSGVPRSRRSPMCCVTAASIPPRSTPKSILWRSSVWPCRGRGAAYERARDDTAKGRGVLEGASSSRLGDASDRIATEELCALRRGSRPSRPPHPGSGVGLYPGLTSPKLPNCVGTARS